MTINHMYPQFFFAVMYPVYIPLIEMIYLLVYLTNLSNDRIIY